MSEKDLRHLRRGELLEIIYEMKKNEEALRQELDQRSASVSELGSIAESALAVNGVFSAAQAAADEYVKAAQSAQEQAESALAEVDDQCQKLIAEAQQQADALLAEAQETSAQTRTAAEEYAAVKRQEADAYFEKVRTDVETKCAERMALASNEIAQKWETFNKQVEQTLEAHAQLKAFLQD